MSDMWVDLLDRLRCPADHEESWLVASAARTVDRHILEGALGCPVCGAEYAIRDGDVWFGSAERPASANAPVAGEDAPLRLGAMLGLDERGGVYVLDGRWSACLPEISGVFPDARFFLLSPADVGGAGAVLRGTGDAIPLAAAHARGVALDRASDALANAAARVLSAGGRLVAPAASAVPAGISVLARDDAWWVGERGSVPTLPTIVTPRRAAPRTGSR